MEGAIVGEFLGRGRIAGRGVFGERPYRWLGMGPYRWEGRGSEITCFLIAVTRLICEADYFLSPTTQKQNMI